MWELQQAKMVGEVVGEVVLYPSRQRKDTFNVVYSACFRVFIDLVRRLLHFHKLRYEWLRFAPIVHGFLALFNGCVLPQLKLK